MGIFRNMEVLSECLADLAVVLAAAVLSLFLDPSALIFILPLGVCLIFLHLYFAKKRYEKITELSDTLNRILHGQEELFISSCSEGELAILSSEISKMTLRLKEQTDLLKKDKLRLTDAISDIFHQIRTPLTSLNLVVSLLSEENLTYERRISLVREEKRQLQRISWLVEALLKISKIDAGTASFQEDSVSVKDMIRKAAEPFLIPMELKGIDFTAQIGAEAFKGDLLWSVEAFGNLIKNCMEHTPEGGSVCVRALENALYTQIVVSDTGEGFCSEDIPYLFDRFYKGQNASPLSIGIGLSLARMIITAENGTITAENGKDGGAVFTVRFYKSII